MQHRRGQSAGLSPLSSHLPLQIEAQSLDAGKLALAFGEIEEIEGYMVVRFSPNIVSLHMFKKLRKIHGNVLYRQRSVGRLRFERGGREAGEIPDGLFSP